MSERRTNLKLTNSRPRGEDILLEKERERERERDRKKRQVSRRETPETLSKEDRARIGWDELAVVSKP